MENNIRKQPHKCHHEEAPMISKIFFCWAPMVFYKKFRNEVLEEESFETLNSQKSAKLGSNLEKAWKKELGRSGNPSLWRALISTFGLEFSVLGSVFLFREFALKMVEPWLIRKIMRHYTHLEPNNSKREIHIYGSLILLVSFLNVLISHNYMLKIQNLGMKIRISCCSLIYRKSLKMSKTELAETTNGKIINLLSNDVNRFDSTPMFIQQLFIAPIESVIVMYFLYTTGGAPCLAGIVFLLLFVPTQMYMGKLASRFRLKVSTTTDQRITLMNEILSGIQVIKMYVWEKPFSDLVEKARIFELRKMKSAAYLKAFNVSFMLILNRTGIFLCILAYAIYNNRVEAEYVFVVSSCFGILRQALTVYFPFGINNVAESRVSMKRIRVFLMAEELNSQPDKIIDDVQRKLKPEPADITIDNDAPGESDQLLTKAHSTELNHHISEKSSIGIKLTNIWVKSKKSSPSYTLKNINLEILSSETVAVIGAVGSGKSTLLLTILKEVSNFEGEIFVNGSISYASQEPWLFAGSVRQNILFGSQYIQDRYEQVLKVCCLTKDLVSLQQGDASLIGENGVLLSGGQKARINLARAVYRDADLYLLDDPFSAVDQKVGNSIFQECILEFLKNKCTILITHHVQYLNSVDRVYVMENDTIHIKDVSNDLTKLAENVAAGSTEDIAEIPINNNLKKDPENTEIRKLGAVSNHIYRTYFKSGGNIVIPIILLLFLLAQLSASGSDYFVGFWVNLERGHKFFTVQTCIIIYSAIIALLALITIIRSITFYRFCIKISETLHNKMFSSVINAPISFFNLNPSGRIINRFSKDLGLIDEILPSIMMETCQIAFIVLGSALVITVLNPWILIINLLIMLLLYYIRKIFLAYSRNLKRLESTRRSPIFSHVNSSLNGVTTIRSFNIQKKLQKEFDQYQDLHTSTFYNFLTCNRAFGFYVDMICVFYTIVVISSIILMDSRVGDVGLAITQSINLIGVCQWGLRQWSEMENQMVSVERIVEYSEIKPENETETEPKEPKNWPSSGEITFRAVYLRYDNTEQPVLRNITVDIASKEKIGIVGRTGSGKTSFVSLLFHLYHYEGDILIDGVDTKTIPIKTLRSSISIIPQEPILFTGTIKQNLDPFCEYNDHQLWKALEQVKLKEVIEELPQNLQHKVLGGGNSFSVGQRQLICLARAILRKNTMFVLDEATSSMDSDTDRLIQNTIKREFKDCTVLTIAHRLDTILESDRILVMDSGGIVEFDTPQSLLENRSGSFYKMVQESNKDFLDANEKSN